MSFVGTRPEAVKYVKKYKPEYMASILLSDYGKIFQNIGPFSTKGEIVSSVSKLASTVTPILSSFDTLKSNQSMKYLWTVWSVWLIASLCGNKNLPCGQTEFQESARQDLSLFQGKFSPGI